MSFLLNRGGANVNFINNLFFREESVVKEETSFNTSDSLLRALINGEVIDKDKALSIPAISSAVDTISNLVAICPINLYKKEKDQETGAIKTIKIEDGRTHILNWETGDTLSPLQMKKAIVKDYLTEKGAYVYIERGIDGFKSLRYVEPSQVSILKNVDPIFKDIKYQVYSRDYETWNFLTILRNTTDGAKGKSAIEEITKSIETAYTTIIYELGLVQKGGGKKGFLSSKRKLGKDELNALKAAWREYYGNANENVIILNDGLEFQEGASSSVELQMNERKQTLRNDIKDVFHIFDNYDDTIKNAVLPIISAIEDALNRDFLLESEKGSFYFAFDTKEIIKGDIKTRFEAYKTALDSNLMQIDECRYLENLEPIGLNFVKLGLQDVLFNPVTKEIYTPNTNQITNIERTEDNEDRNQE